MKTIIQIIVLIRILESQIRRLRVDLKPFYLKIVGLFSLEHLLKFAQLFHRMFFALYFSDGKIFCKDIWICFKQAVRK